MAPDSGRTPGILVVDDEPAVGRIVRSSLRVLTEDIVVVQSGQEAIEACAARGFDVVISDMRMPGMDGTELLQLLAHDYPSMRRIILTGHADVEHTMKAINAGRVQRYLTKPWKNDELADVVREEIQLAEKERTEIVRLRSVIEKLSEPDT